MSVRLLVVDDQPSIRRLFELVVELDERYLAVVTAGTAEQALEQALPDTDVILLDADLGSTDGLDLIPDLRCQSPRAVIAVHSSASYASGRTAQQAGADLFIAKGTDLDELLGVLVARADGRTRSIIDLTQGAPSCL